MTDIGACDLQTLVRLQPNLLDAVRNVIIKEDSGYTGNLFLKTEYSVKEEGTTPIMLYVTDEKHEIAPYVEGKAPVDCYDATRATLKNVVLRYYKKVSEAQINIASNLTPWAVKVGTKNLMEEASNTSLDAEMDVLLIIPNKSTVYEWRPNTKEEYMDAQLITLFTGASPEFLRHKQLLEVFGKTLLDNNSFRFEFRGSPHRLISSHHLVAAFIGLEETKHHPVIALGEVLEVAEVFVVPEPIFQELADLCFATYTRCWDTVDVHKIALSVTCETPLELELEIDWYFELPLKRLPDGVTLESISMSTTTSAQLVNALLQATSRKEYVFQKKAYDKTAAGETK